MIRKANYKNVRSVFSFFERAAYTRLLVQRLKKKRTGGAK